MLVWKLGIVGAAIGTLVAMIIRTVEFVCYTSKHILDRSIWQTFKCLGIVAIEVIIISIIMNFIHGIEVYSYGTWMLDAIMVGSVSLIVVIFINGIAYKESFKILISKLKNNLEFKFKQG